MSEIFISYKREEREKAHAIAESLARRGFSVWWDIDLLPGDRFADEIGAVIEKAKAAVVLWSEDAVKSDFVRAEASKASDRGILIPVRLDNCELPLPFGALHTLDLRGWDGSIDNSLLTPLIAAIEKKIGRSSETKESPDAVEEILERPRGEVIFWKSISEQNKQEAREYQAYLEKYGKEAFFYDLAIIRKQKLRLNESTEENASSKVSLSKAGTLATIVGTVIAAISLYFTMNGKSDLVEKLCDEPIYEMVEDAKLCGTEEKIVVISPATPATCRRAEFDIEGYVHTQTVTQSSGWRGGGSNPTNWCNELISGFVSSRGIGDTAISKVINTGEDARWTGTFGRTRQYNYTCTVKISWEPIYFEKTDPACGMLPEKTRTDSIPKKCRTQVGVKKVKC